MCNFVPSQGVKTGGYAKKTVLVNLTFSIFCRLPNLLLRNQHCSRISFFAWKPGVRNPDLCFSLHPSGEKRHNPFSESKGLNFRPYLFASLGSSGKKISSLFRRQGSEFWTLALRSAEIVNKNLCLKSKDPNFGPLLFAPLK